MKKTNMDQDVLRRLKTALNLAAKRLSAEASKGNPASHISGTPENFAARHPNDKSVTPKRGEGKHYNAVLETGVGVVPRDMAKTVENEHPSLKTGATAYLPKVRGYEGVYDMGGVAPSAGNFAPDGALIAAQEQGSSQGSVPTNMVRSDSPDADHGRFQGFKDSINGQGETGGKHVPIRGMGKTHTSNDDPLLDVSHPASQLQWMDDGGRVSPLGRIPTYDDGGETQEAPGQRELDRDL